MHIAARSVGRVVLILVLVTLVPASFAADRQRIEVNDYVIQAVVSPETHQLKAIAKVKFTALDDISIATFQLHNGLRPTRVLDDNGQTLSAERISQDSSVRISLPTGPVQRHDHHQRTNGLHRDRQREGNHGRERSCDGRSRR